MFSLIRNSAAFEQLPYETFTRPYCYTRCIIKRSEILLALLMKLDSASLRAGLLCCLNFQTGWEKYLFTGCPPGWMPNKFTPGAGAFGRPFRTKRERERERERERYPRYTMYRRSCSLGFYLLFRKIDIAIWAGEKKKQYLR